MDGEAPTFPPSAPRLGSLVEWAAVPAGLPCGPLQGTATEQPVAFVLVWGMPKQPTKQPQKQSWAAYHIRARPRSLSASSMTPPMSNPPPSAIEEYQVPANERSRLIARGRD
jgi:hypothetical protein